MWVLQHNPCFAKKGEYIWSNETYEQIFGNVKYISKQRDDVIMTAIQMFLDDANSADKEQAFQLSIIHIETGVVVTDVDDYLTFDSESIFEMVLECSKIGAKADQLKSSLLKLIEDWHSTKEQEHWFHLSVFNQKLVEYYPDNISDLIKRL